MHFEVPHVVPGVIYGSILGTVRFRVRVFLLAVSREWKNGARNGGCYVEFRV